MRRLALLVAAAALLTAGCAKDVTPAEPSPDLPPKSATSTAATTTTTAAAPKKNARGLIPKQLGEEAGIGNLPDANAVTFSIDAVTIDPPCYEYGTKPEAGRTLLLEVRVATGSDADSTTYISGFLNSSGFVEVGTDGVTRNAQPGSCTDWKGSLPNQFGLNQKYVGTIEIVVPEASGVIALQTVFGDGPGGWEWSYPR